MRQFYGYCVSNDSRVKYLLSEKVEHIDKFSGKEIVDSLRFKNKGVERLRKKKSLETTEKSLEHVSFHLSHLLNCFYKANFYHSFTFNILFALSSRN